MHNHDLDTIAAYADGSLAVDLIDEARAAVDSCAECRAEYDAQRMILDVLAEASPATMTELERVRIHRAVAEAAPPKSAPMWLTWGSRVAVAAVAVAFVGSLGFFVFGGGSDDGAVSERANAAADVAEEGTDGMTQAEAPAESGGDSALKAPTTDAAASDEMLESTAATSFARLGPIDGADFSAGNLAFEEYREASEALSDQILEELACLSDAEVEPLTFVGIGTFEGAPVEVYVSPEETLVLAVSDCAVVDIP